MNDLKRKIVSLLIAGACASSVSLPVFCGEADKMPAPDGWAIPYVQQADKLGIIPAAVVNEWQRPITRGEFCSLAYNMLTKNDGELLKKLASDGSGHVFADAADSVEISSLYDAGIINGRSDSEFAPHDTITREEAAAILSRMANALGIKAETHSDIAYSDDADISDWARGDVYEMLALGIMNGTDAGFEPKGEYTVEQSIATMMRINDKTSSAGSSTNASSDVHFTDRLNSMMPKDKNYMFSPLSVKTALLLAANGAEGETQRQICALTDVSDLAAANAKTKSDIERYSQSDIIKLSSANSIWINSSRTDSRFSSVYENTVKEYYGAEAGIVDDTDAQKTINGWVSDKTNGKIPSILDSSDFDVSLINAVYFKGAWQNEFSEYATAKDTFHNADGSTSETDFMNDRGWYDYYEGADGTKIVRLAYKNHIDRFSDDGDYIGSETTPVNAAMYIILSDSFEEHPEQTIAEAMRGGKQSSTYLDLSIPKFKFDYSASLADTLKMLGMERAFDDDAEFSPMLDRQVRGGLRITEVLHKTYIDVNEKGTEAAAVTAMSLAGASLPPEPVPFKADKPFTFVICDDSNDGEVLFAGRFAKAE